VSAFLETMIRSSAARAAEARARAPLRALERRLASAPPTRPLRPSPEGFDLLAEIKPASPASGRLASGSIPGLVSRAEAYAAAGAAAISVLTEPDRFGGDLSHLSAVAGAVPVPVMRKDFLVDPYQVLEARAAVASGILLIVRLHDRVGLAAMIRTARDAGMFVLLECFDGDDARRAVEAAGGDPDGQILFGVNARDLDTLKVDRGRLASFRPAFPAGSYVVAESGTEVPADVEHAVALGYAAVLVGTALMRAADPAALARDMISAGRRANVTGGAR